MPTYGLLMKRTPYSQDVGRSAMLIALPQTVGYENESPRSANLYEYVVDGTTSGGRAWGIVGKCPAVRSQKLPATAMREIMRVISSMDKVETRIGSVK